MSKFSAARLRRFAGFTIALAVIPTLGLARPALANKDTAPGQQKKQESAGSSEAAAPSSSASSSQGGQAPAGNNGTVKINDTAVDDGPNNEPHVACQFWVNFYGYDAGAQSATMTFEPWAPTKGGHEATFSTSWTTAERTGGNQLDKSYGPVDLSSALAGITPHPKQGFHVKLTVHVTGSHGADVKHKVFWIEPCRSAVTAVGGTKTNFTATIVSGVETSQPTTAPAPTVAAAAVGSASPAGPQVLGVSMSRLPGALARTGAPIAHLLVAAISMIAFGFLLLRIGRRSQAHV